MSRMSRSSLLIGFFAGGWAATLLLVFVPALGLRGAMADDPPNTPILPPAGSNTPTPAPSATGPTLPSPPSSTFERGAPNPGGGNSDSNNRAIALAASAPGGDAVVYYFDTVAQRVLVYQYKGLVSGNRPLRRGDKGGLRLLAARHIDYDLRAEGYRDLSEFTREQLKEKFEAVWGKKKAADKGAGGLPTKVIDASK